MKRAAPVHEHATRKRAKVSDEPARKSQKVAKARTKKLADEDVKIVDVLLTVIENGESSTLAFQSELSVTKLLEGVETELQNVHLDESNGRLFLLLPKQKQQVALTTSGLNMTAPNKPIQLRFEVASHVDVNEGKDEPSFGITLHVDLDGGGFGSKRGGKEQRIALCTAVELSDLDDLKGKIRDAVPRAVESDFTSLVRLGGGNGLSQTLFSFSQLETDLRTGDVKLGMTLGQEERDEEQAEKAKQKRDAAMRKEKTEAKCALLRQQSLQLKLDKQRQQQEQPQTLKTVKKSLGALALETDQRVQDIYRQLLGLWGATLPFDTLQNWARELEPQKHQDRNMQVCPTHLSVAAQHRYTHALASKRAPVKKLQHHHADREIQFGQLLPQPGYSQPRPLLAPPQHGYDQQLPAPPQHAYGYGYPAPPHHAYGYGQPTPPQHAYGYGQLQPAPPQHAYGYGQLLHSHHQLVDNTSHPVQLGNNQPIKHSARSAPDGSALLTDRKVRQNCGICLTGDPVYAYIPCGHCIVCSSCYADPRTQKLRMVCIQCQGAATALVRIFI